jgi:prepilin-type N-terminal cleavage/methylation domain-containing protein
MKKSFEKGFSLLELLIVLFAFALLLLPTMAYFNRYHRAILLDSTAKKIVEAAGLAREYAVNERKEFCLILSEDGFAVLRENRELVGKGQRFPDRIRVKEKSSGFDPAVFKPDGTSKNAGYLIIEDEVRKEEVKIVLHNITGRCFISDTSP